MLKAITFDFWNTLYKPPPDLTMSERRVQEFKQASHSIGYEYTDAEIRSAFKECWEFAHRQQRINGIDITPTGHIDFILDKLKLKATQEQWNELYRAYTAILIKYPPEINDGVKETIPLLVQRYKLAVICNTGVTPGITLREFMKGDDIYRFFDYQVFSDEVKWAKPNVKIFEYTLKKLQVVPNEAAHIGDDSTTDIAGAKGAGMTAIWLSPQRDETIDYDYHVTNIKELIGLFTE